MLGFIAFPMPEIFPRYYWLFHSLWHVLLAAGYYELYALIELDGDTVYSKPQRQRHVRAPQHTAKAVQQAMTDPTDVAKLPCNPRLHIASNRDAKVFPASKTNGESADSEASTGTDFDVIDVTALGCLQPSLGVTPLKQ